MRRSAAVSGCLNAENCSFIVDETMFVCNLQTIFFCNRIAVPLEHCEHSVGFHRNCSLVSKSQRNLYVVRLRQSSPAERSSRKKPTGLQSAVTG